MHIVLQKKYIRKISFQNAHQMEYTYKCITLISAFKIDILQMQPLLDKMRLKKRKDPTSLNEKWKPDSSHFAQMISYCKCY